MLNHPEEKNPSRRLSAEDEEMFVKLSTSPSNVSGFILLSSGFHFCIILSVILHTYIVSRQRLDTASGIR